MSFLADTQSNNTQIYPIVTIEPPDTPLGWSQEYPRVIHLSTNNVSLDHVHLPNTSTTDLIGNVNFKPLLLKMPTINQSIDTKNRKFKVSNVTVNILNNEYQGERFSDIFDNKSLIGWLVSIQLVSPTANKFSTVYVTSNYNESWYDYYKDDPDFNTTMTQMVYQGRIRDAYQNKESVTLKLEDILGQKGHSAIPNNFAGYSSLVPEKHHGNAIPIVFGDVIKSPLVMDVHEDKVVLVADVLSDSGDIGSAFVTTDEHVSWSAGASPLKALVDGSYFSIFSFNSSIYDSETIVGDRLDYYSGNQQYTLPEGSAFIEMFNPSTIDSDGEFPITPIRDDIAFGYIEDIGGQPYIYRAADNFTLMREYNAAISERTFRHEHHNIGELSSNTQIAHIAEPAGTTDPEGTEYEFTQKDLRWIVNFPSKPGVVTGHTKGNLTAVLKSRQWIYNTFNINAFDCTAVGPGGGWQNPGAAVICSASMGVIASNTGTGQSSAANPQSSAGLISSYELQIGGTQTLSLDNHQSIWSRDSDSDSIRYAVYTDGPDGNIAHAGIYKINISNYEAPRRRADYFIGNVKARDFFGHITGRTVDGVVIQNPITIMKYITETFLGAQVDQASYDIALAEHYDWKFNFTIGEVINTKKLLEDMAKSTKCFVRFNESSMLEFNTIKQFYLASDYTNAIPIDDAIAYTFKLSNLSEIPSKIDVEYAKDHGLDKYLEKTDLYSAPGVDYYGIDIGSDTSHKQLKSDYISDSTTAMQLLNFDLDYNRNRRLQTELTLGLNNSKVKVGDLIKFPKLLGGQKAQGIDYSTLEYLNGQWRYPLFIVTSVKIGTNNIKIKADQLPCLTNIQDSANWTNILLQNNLTITGEIQTELDLSPPGVFINFFQSFTGATITETSGNFAVTAIGDTTASPLMEFMMPTAIAIDDDYRITPWSVEVIKADSVEGVANEIITSGDIEALDDWAASEELMQISLPPGINTLRYRGEGVTSFKDITLTYSDGTPINSIYAQVVNDGKFINVDYSTAANNGLYHVVLAGAWVEDETGVPWESPHWNYYNKINPWYEGTQGFDPTTRPLNIDSYGLGVDVNESGTGEQASYLDAYTAYHTTGSQFTMNDADKEFFGTHSHGIDGSWYSQNAFSDELSAKWRVDFTWGTHPNAGYITRKNAEGIYNKITWRVVALNADEYNNFLARWNDGAVEGMIHS